MLNEVQVEKLKEVFETEMQELESVRGRDDVDEEILNRELRESRFAVYLLEIILEERTCRRLGE